MFEICNSFVAVIAARPVAKREEGKGIEGKGRAEPPKKKPDYGPNCCTVLVLC